MKWIATVLIVLCLANQLRFQIPLDNQHGDLLSVHDS